MKTPDETGTGASSPQIALRPVGVVRSPLKEPSLVAADGDLTWKARADRESRRQSVVSEIIVDPDLTGITEGLEDFSHVLVLYWAHRVPPEGRSLIKAHPMGRKDLPLVGIFATCSPARPNSVCATVVQLMERNQNVLKVEGLDAIDESPVIDIKPYAPGYYPAGEVRIAPWMERIYREFGRDSTGSTTADQAREAGKQPEG